MVAVVVIGTSNGVSIRSWGSAGYGLQDHGLRIASGLVIRANCRITDYLLASAIAVDSWPRLRSEITQLGITRLTSSGQHTKALNIKLGVIPLRSLGLLLPTSL